MKLSHLIKFLLSKGKNYNHLANFLESLGVVGIKLGQIISTRFDLFPKELLESVSKLRDSVTPESYEYIESTVEEVVGPLTNTFLTFDRRPVATASIAQVHRAILLDGSEVVVKVRKKNVLNEVNRSLFLLKILITPFRIFNFGKTVYEFFLQLSRTLPEELSFNIEANSMRIIGSKLSYSCVPEIYPQYSNSKVLVMEYIEGITFSELIIEDLDSKYAEKLAYRLINTMLEQTMVQGFYHADLHHSNIKLSNDNLYLLDFGMTGRVVGKDRENLCLLAYGFIKNNEYLVMRSMLNLCNHSKVDQEGLLYEVRRLMDNYVNQELSQVDFSYAIMDLPRVLKKYGVFIKPSMLYVVKNLVTVEGVAISIYPHISIKGMLKEFENKLLLVVGENVLNAKLIDSFYHLRGESSG